ncbi:MAG: glutamyl-tRNA reductase [Verrucomicrobiales bacterium]
MKLVCLGVSHETAPVEVRERLAVSESRLGEEARHLIETGAVSEGVVISTCNRTEYYAMVNGGRGADFVEEWVSARRGVEHSGRGLFYKHEDEAVARHLCDVVSGLDSMVLGETEIFGQVKKAYRLALEAKVTGRGLNRLFQKAFGVGKKVRTLTKIQEGQTSVGSVAVDLAEKIFGDLKNTSVMVIGAGEMSRTTAQSLKSRGARSLMVTNRSYDRAVELAEELGGEAFRFDDWTQALAKVDVVISSTGAPHAVVHAEHVESVRRKRRYRPLFFIDIAVPRDIDEEVGEIEEVYLYDMDAMQELAAQGRERREEQVRRCRRIIAEEVAKMGLFEENEAPEERKSEAAEVFLKKNDEMN